jgi:hypothetical protein
LRAGGAKSTKHMRIKTLLSVPSVKRDLISVKRDLISVKRDLISVNRDLISVKRDLISVKSDLISTVPKMRIQTLLSVPSVKKT